MCAEFKTIAGVSELRSHTGFWLRFVSNHVSQAFAQRLAPCGVTVAEWVLLREMFDREEMAPSALAESTGLTRGAISKLIDRMVGKRLVSRKGSSHDRRYQTIGLTATGTRLVPSLAAIADENDEDFFAALSLAERKALEKTLKKLVKAKGLGEFPVV